MGMQYSHNNNMDNDTAAIEDDITKRFSEGNIEDIQACTTTGIPCNPRKCNCRNSKDVLALNQQSKDKIMEEMKPNQQNLYNILKEQTLTVYDLITCPEVDLDEEIVTNMEENRIANGGMMKIYQTSCPDEKRDCHKPEKSILTDPVGVFNDVCKSISATIINHSCSTDPVNIRESKYDVVDGEQLNPGPYSQMIANTVDNMMEMTTALLNPLSCPEKKKEVKKEVIKEVKPKEVEIEEKKPKPKEKLKCGEKEKKEDDTCTK